MLAVKFKNAALRALSAAIANGELPAGTVISGNTKDRRVWIDIDAAPFDCLLAKNIENTPHGVVFSVTLCVPDEQNYTPEGIALKAQVEKIARAICPEGLFVHFSSKCFTAQGRRQKAAQAPSTIAAIAAACLAIAALAAPATAQQWSWEIDRPGEFPSYLTPQPFGQGGYTVEQPGQMPYQINPAFGGGYSIDYPGQNPTYIRPQPFGGFNAAPFGCINTTVHRC